ncbi:MAG TPA: cupin domain-containing protein [Verrucomicrobiae bacterium]|jgi:nitric oxide dioxygenase|nr:cupin domain-containing protein [Verrucomicrobiae bacterium]
MQLASEIQFREGGIYSKVLAHGKHFSCTLMCLAKGTGMDEHSTPRAGVLHVIQGRGSFALEGTALRMEPGTIICMKASAPHALTAEENVAFLLYLYE